MELNSKRVYSLMASKEMSNKALSIETGIRQQHLSDILKRGTCTIVTLGRIAKTLGVDPEEIMK